VKSNSLCLAQIPEYRARKSGYTDLPIRYRCCQRKAEHKGPHRSWSRQWGDEDKESRITHGIKVEVE
jgi:hypothetical protein